MASDKKDDEKPSAQTSAFTAGDEWRSDLTGGLFSPDDEAPARLLPGAKLGQYVLVEKIGEGGMGLVFKATDTSLERTVALKVMFCGPHDDQRQAQRFEREARQMARLSHPNLLHVYSVGADSGCHFFAMELLRGETLLNAVRRLNGIPAPDLMQYAVQIVSALYYVHQKGITHRDIKSGNIMLCGRRAVLMDFGLAKDETDSGLTTVGAIMGTPDYMPPEAAEGRSAGPATDIYSLGVVLYEALSGQLPFVGKSAISIIRQHIDTPPPDLQMLVPEIKPELAAIVHKCLEKNPDERFQNCPELARALWDIHPDQIVLDVAEGRVAGSDEVPLEHTHFGSKSGPPGATAQPRSAPPRAKTGAGTAVQSTSAANQSAGRPDRDRIRPNLSPTVTHVKGLPGEADPDAATEPSVPVAKPRRRTDAAQNLPAWVWAIMGFVGMIAIVFLVIVLTHKPAQKTKAYAGQPVILKGAQNEKELLLEFKSNDPDPKKWYFVVRRLKPDGTWTEDLKIPYSEYVSQKMDTELIFTTDDAQRKP